ncbi:MAG: outer membrane protein assembly factor BamE [Deltaproteobacteria bacterium]|nr:outer membrane protein assembly factor BamE [Deltaproteobacteria bacterium]
MAGVFGVAMLGGGCLTAGRNFNAAPVPQIEKGVTTREDVRRHFGEPFRQGLDDGHESWTYVYNRWSLFAPARSKDLYVVFNGDGTVRSYTYNSNLER